MMTQPQRSSAGASGEAMAETSDQHIQPYSHLLAVLLGLLALTGVTVAVSRIELGALNIWIAILIASVKSSLVLLFFMHLKFEGRFIRITFLVTIFTLAVLIGFLFWDISFR
jgi:cytochrome c oxidase subunit 4